VVNFKEKHCTQFILDKTYNLHQHPRVFTRCSSPLPCWVSLLMTMNVTMIIMTH